MESPSIGIPLFPPPIVNTRNSFDLLSIDSSPTNFLFLREIYYSFPSKTISSSNFFNPLISLLICSCLFFSIFFTQTRFPILEIKTSFKAYQASVGAFKVWVCLVFSFV